MPFHIVAGSLNQPATYFQWGWLGISLPNLVVMLLTVAVFVLAVLLPFPHHDEDES
jgi:hypothetical protein